jgi:glycyl-tRNA synthetase
MKEENKMEKIVSLAKRRGFIFQGSEIYGGLAGTWDYGPFGVALKNNIKNLWWKHFVDSRDDMYGLDSAILMNEKVWEASGHVSGFSDPLVECKKCKKRFRADHLEDKDKCPECVGELSKERQFNMMFETQVGAQGDMKSYLRPETAQGMFVNFKNIVDTMRPKLPFGMAQIGKAFRNEISPRDFIFRTREFEQMEIEYFIDEKDWEKQFDYWIKEMRNWNSEIGLDEKKINELEVPEEDRAHYSKRTVDFEYEFPFGISELYGLAYRTDYDLSKHSEHSGERMVYRDAEGDEYTPHVIEPTFGVDRTVLAILSEAYTEDEMGGETRTFLKLKPEIAPIKAAVFPLMKNKPELVKKAREVYEMLKKEIPQIMWDDNGNVGKRYRRQDEIGTPVCITIDFDTLEDDSVTVRDRDTGNQKRVKIEDLTTAI